MRAQSSGISLDYADVAIVKAMLQRGDRQHDIAAWFGVNGGRIAEISSGIKFSSVQACSGPLPPPGPYMSGQQSQIAKQALLDTRATLEKMIEEIDKEISKL